jgi:ribonuclease D
VLDSTISKRQQVSNWEKEDLTPAQQRYAATDAWTSLKIHDTLRANYYLD